MSKKKKEFPVKDMKELEELHYGKDGDDKAIDWGRYRRYGSWIQGEIHSPIFEGLVKSIFAPLGAVEKIPEQEQRRTYDFKIDQSKILLETTSLSVTLTALKTTVDNAWVLRKLQDAVIHVKGKDTPSLPEYFRGGLIVYETESDFLTKFHMMLNSQLTNSLDLDDGLDFLAFTPQPASINSMSSSEQLPTVFYVKDGPLVDMFRRAFQNKNYTIFVV